MYPRKTKKSGPINKHKAGRVCKKHGCRQRLSVYNPEEYCHAHRREFQGKLD